MIWNSVLSHRWICPFHADNRIHYGQLAYCPFGINNPIQIVKVTEFSRILVLRRILLKVWNCWPVDPKVHVDLVDVQDTRCAQEWTL